MKVRKKIILSLAFALLSTSYYAFAKSEKTITYRNQRGSILTLIWHADNKETGTLSGEFSSAVGNCKTDVNVPLPVIGFFNGNAIAITVNFPHCKAAVAMTGHLSANDKKLSTLWLDAVQAKDPIYTDWDANITGADYFKQIE